LEVDTRIHRREPPLHQSRREREIGGLPAEKESQACYMIDGTDEWGGMQKWNERENRLRKRGGGKLARLDPGVRQRGSRAGSRRQCASATERQSPRGRDTSAKRLVTQRRSRKAFAKTREERTSGTNVRYYLKEQPGTIASLNREKKK